MADQGTEGLLSRFLRNQRMKAVKPYLNGRILDVGCGTGALAAVVDRNLYCGVEIDQFSLNCAKNFFPFHRFVGAISEVNEKFDTIVALAVIEHVDKPFDFLKELSQFLVNATSSKIVITTPHPSVDWIHTMGGKIGLFSRHANEEHKALLDKRNIFVNGELAELSILHYQRFLFGANQIAVFRKGPCYGNP